MMMMMMMMMINATTQEAELQRSQIVFETLHVLTPFDIDEYWRAMCLRWLTVCVDYIRPTSVLFKWRNWFVSAVTIT